MHHSSKEAPEVCRNGCMVCTSECTDSQIVRSSKSKDKDLLMVVAAAVWPFSSQPHKAIEGELSLE